LEEQLCFHWTVAAEDNAATTALGPLILIKSALRTFSSHDNLSLERGGCHNIMNRPIVRFATVNLEKTLFFLLWLQTSQSGLSQSPVQNRSYEALLGVGAKAAERGIPKIQKELMAVLPDILIFSFW
jgi:hypothetical protein